MALHLRHWLDVTIYVKEHKVQNESSMHIQAETYIIDANALQNSFLLKLEIALYFISKQDFTIFKN